MPLNVMCVEMFHDQHPQTIQRRNDFLFCRNITPVIVVHHCIRRQCFILLPNVWVVFKIYFAIHHKIVAINNVQQSIRLNKRKGEGKKFLRFRTTSGQPCYTSGSFALSTWPYGRDVLICRKCVVIFLKTVLGVTFNLI